MSGWSLLCLRFAVSFAAAAVSKVVVEDTVRFRAMWARGRAGVATFVAVTLGVAAFWVLVPRPETAPAIFSLDQLASTTASPTSAALPSTTASSVNPSLSAPTSIAAASQRHSVPRPLRFAPVPTLLAPTSRVLMTGDSVAFDEWPAVAAAMYAGKIAIGSYVSPGAGLLDAKYQ